MERAPHPSPFQRSADPELVVFDLDGTLVDSVPSLARAIDTMLQRLGFAPAGEAAVRRWVGNGAAVLVERALQGVAGIAPGSDPALQQQAQQWFLEAYEQCACQDTYLYQGVQPFLAALAERRLPMAVVTNKPLRFVPPILEALQIDGYFRLLVGGDCLPNKKPHPQPLLHAARRFGVKPERALMIGDSVHDVRAARNALFEVACVSYGYNHGEPVADSKPDWVVDSLMELL